MTILEHQLSWLVQRLLCSFYPDRDTSVTIDTYNIINHLILKSFISISGYDCHIFYERTWQEVFLPQGVWSEWSFSERLLVLQLKYDASIFTPHFLIVKTENMALSILSILLLGVLITGPSSCKLSQLCQWNYWIIMFK